MKEYNKLPWQGGGCRRILSREKNPVAGTCSESRQKTCVYPKDFDCQCRPERFTNLAAATRICTCDAETFEVAMQAEQAKIRAEQGIAKQVFLRIPQLGLLRIPRLVIALRIPKLGLLRIPRLVIAECLLRIPKSVDSVWVCAQPLAVDCRRLRRRRRRNPRGAKSRRRATSRRRRGTRARRTRRGRRARRTRRTRRGRRRANLSRVRRARG